MRRLLRMLLRRRVCTGPLVLLLALLLLCYQTLMVDRNQERSESQEVLMETRRLVSALEALQEQTQAWFSSQRRLHRRRQAMVLTGRLSDTEVGLQQRVLQQMDYEVHVSRFAETSRFWRTQHGGGGWSLLLCLSTSERSCLRRISFSHLQQHQMVNLLPELMEAFSDVAGGLCHVYPQLTGSDLLMKPHSCGSSNQNHPFPQDRRSPDRSPALVALVNVFVLVTSVTPLTSFMHDVSVVMTHENAPGQQVKIRAFLVQQLGASTSQQALLQIQRVIGSVLQAVSTNQEQEAGGRCLLCFQLLTFTLMFSGSITPVIVQVDTELSLRALSDDSFSRQITKDRILEDTLRFLLPLPTHLGPEAHLSLESLRQQYGGCRGTRCLSQEELLLLLRFQQQLKIPSAFQLSVSVSLQLYPSTSSSSSSSSPPLNLSSLLLRVSRHYELQRSSRELDKPTNQQSASLKPAGSCVDPHLRQIYTDPPLILTPPFSPTLKEYRAEVPFDTVTVRIRPEPVSSTCVIHLDNQRGPRTANFPVGLGNSRISILVTDAAEPHPVMTVYTVNVFREARPSLPMFGDHVTCSFLQDCGLQVQPALSCGLQPHVTSQSPAPPCGSGHVPGRWVVPCLSCSDNRTCDWREVTWQPDGCYHPLVERPLLEDCMRDRKVLFMGDSTNRGMMYFLMERVNSSLEDWGKAHDMLLYQNLNRGRTHVSYSYYPRFWLEQNQRPTFREALLQLLNRSRPLENSNQTVLVVGGVQWLNTVHLRTVQEVLDRESLSEILVVVKSLGMGFHLPVDGIRSLSLLEIRNLFLENGKIVSTARRLGYEVIDTFSITMGRYKEFLQGRCACHFHEVEKLQSSRPPGNMASAREKTRTTRTGPGPSSQSTVLDAEQEVRSTFHVRGAVNQVYSEILLSRLCPEPRGTGSR
ncbi:cadherin-like and PC-esterase domain-containing protein 1 isoform X2 [Fundulus heteroclitus]|uniref:cadherin-like and PC-esterase domain-containing protein 1 isoform X2 n=1 Tax=Fundulus heteroclitus TaxID=8078 RepID=UPI00165AF44E|nr:cadherin-like and PC-esterase domain-containing protein 1 isoform X2 [Fundulus heteroclitus]